MVIYLLDFLWYDLSVFFLYLIDQVERKTTNDFKKNEVFHD